MSDSGSGAGMTWGFYEVFKTAKVYIEDVLYTVYRKYFITAYTFENMFFFHFNSP